MPGPAPPPSAGRLFLGITLPDDTRRALDAGLRAAVGERGLPGRPVPPANWHLTLRFLGETPAAQAERLGAELRAAELGGPFTISLGAFGAYPRPARARVLWVGVGLGAERLAELAAAVEAAARRAGFAAEPRAFRAHLTLSRIQPPRDVRGLLSALLPPELKLQVADVALFRSHLGGGPARYEVIERFAL